MRYEGWLNYANLAAGLVVKHLALWILNPAIAVQIRARPILINFYIVWHCIHAVVHKQTNSVINISRRLPRASPYDVKAFLSLKQIFGKAATIFYKF